VFQKRIAVAFALLLLLSVSAAAAPCSNTITSFEANDALTGQAVTFSWSYDAAVQSQTLTGHDFREPVVLAPGQTSYSYITDLPGEKHATLTAVADCGTVTRPVTYHVQQCNVVAPVLTVDKTNVAPGETISASINILPGHTARWVVTNGTASATTGSAIQVTAGAPGAVVIDVYVARGNSCEVKTTAMVNVAAACSIQQPVISHFPTTITPNALVNYSVIAADGEIVTYAVRGAEMLSGEGDPFLALFAPGSGSFEVDFIVTNGTCTSTFTKVYQVTPCEPTATVSTGGTSCSKTVVIEFTGTAPFSGYFTNGRFFSSSTNRYERSLPAGTYEISFFRDRFCPGTSFSGSAVIPATLSVPYFTVDDIVNGYYYGLATCPGLVRTATLMSPAPAGVEVVWSIENGTIVSGQGTDTVQFYGNAPGQSPLSAVLRNADGCTSQPFTQPYLVTAGVPQLSVSVEPATIGAGGTATVRVTMHDNYVSGLNVYSSLGDAINPDFTYQDPNVMEWKYISTHGGGVATITVEGTSACGDVGTASTTLTIDGGAPVQATATVRGFGSTCSDYLAYAEFTGTAPFTGTWSNGQPFYSDSPYSYLYPQTGGTYTIVEFSDANGAGTVTGEATFDFTSLPAPEFTFTESSVCPNGTTSATLTTPIPDGATVTWTVWGGTILSGQGTGTIEIQAGEFFTQATAQLSAPGACSPMASWQSLNLITWAQQPSISAFPAEVGVPSNIYIQLDPATVTWEMENSLGDPMRVIDNPYPGVYVVEYTPAHGAGQSTIRVWGTARCGIAFEGSTVLEITPARPRATLTSSPDPLCGAIVTATFSGTAPFSGTWSDSGESFTTNETTITRHVRYNTFVFVNNFSDATGQPGISGGVYVDQITNPPYIYMSTVTDICVGKTVTATTTEPPAGYEIEWVVEGTAIRIVSGQGTQEVVVEGIEEGQGLLGIRLRTAAGCTGSMTGATMTVSACPIE
jgi:hypothetical protein